MKNYTQNIFHYVIFKHAERMKEPREDHKKRRGSKAYAIERHKWRQPAKSRKKLVPCVHVELQLKAKSKRIV